MPFLRHEFIFAKQAPADKPVSKQAGEYRPEFLPTHPAALQQAGNIPYIAATAKGSKRRSGIAASSAPAVCGTYWNRQEPCNPIPTAGPREKRLLPEISHDIISRRFCSVSCLYRQSSYRRETRRFPYIVKSILNKQRTELVNSAGDFRKTEDFLFKNQA